MFEYKEICVASVFLSNCTLCCAYLKKMPTSHLNCKKKKNNLIESDKYKHKFINSPVDLLIGLVSAGSGR